jgi:hypothetical protein
MVGGGTRPENSRADRWSANRSTGTTHGEGPLSQLGKNRAGSGRGRKILDAAPKPREDFESDQVIVYRGKIARMTALRSQGRPVKTDMNRQPEPSNQEVLAGLIERVTYHNVENGFCVLRAKARGHRDVVTVVGHAAAIAAGEWITASGEWVNDRTHGQQRAVFFGTPGYETWSPGHATQFDWSLTAVDAALLGPRRFYLTSP